MDEQLAFVDDPGAFLDAAEELFAADPVEATVMVTVSDRMRRERDAGLPGPAGFPVWWALERDGTAAWSVRRCARRRSLRTRCT